MLEHIIMNDGDALQFTADERFRETLLVTFLAEEEHLWKAQADFDNARYALEVARRKYAAVRDMVTKELGESPYEFPQAREFLDQRGREFPTRGSFRFYGMTPGDAAIDVLSHAHHPLTFQELIGRLRAGGIETEESSLGRAINAALLRRGGIGKMADGRYSTTKYKADFDIGDQFEEDPRVVAALDQVGEPHATVVKWFTATKRPPPGMGQNLITRDEFVEMWSRDVDRRADQLLSDLIAKGFLQVTPEGYLGLPETA